MSINDRECVGIRGIRTCKYVIGVEQMMENGDKRWAVREKSVLTIQEMCCSGCGCETRGSFILFIIGKEQEGSSSSRYAERNRDLFHA